MKRIMLLVAFAAVATVASANEDRANRSDGVIPELPLAYEATRLRVAFSESDTGPCSN